MDPRLQAFSIVAAAVLLVFVLELVRRRRLLERYALLWLFCGIVLLGLAIAGGLLSTLAGLIGVESGPNALFVVAFGFVISLLLNFSTVISSLADQNKILAQRIALLEERLRRSEGETEVPGARTDRDEGRAETAESEESAREQTALR